MVTLKNKKKLAPLNKENCDKHPCSNSAQNSNALRSQEDYITHEDYKTQVSDETEERDTKNFSQEFSRNHILGK